MSDITTAYLVSLGIIGAGAIWIDAGTTLCIAIGVPTIVVGLIGLWLSCITERALDTKCPAELYGAAPRPYAGLPELTYPFHDRELLVTACGRLCLHRKRINISTVLAGQKLGIKEVDDGIWLASFMHYDLGYFDLEQKTLQPLDNPFGTRLSPMS